jgi:hypothetical protein
MKEPPKELKMPVPRAVPVRDQSQYGIETQR